MRGPREQSIMMTCGSILFGDAGLFLLKLLQRSVDQLLPLQQNLGSLLPRLRSVVEQREVCKSLVDLLEIRGLLKFVLLLGWQGLPEIRGTGDRQSAKEIVDDSSGGVAKVGSSATCPRVLRGIMLAVRALIFVSCLLHDLIGGTHLFCVEVS